MTEQQVSPTVVPHDVEKCRFCTNPTIRSAVLREDQGADGWQCSACGWATVDLGTMHEQLWPSVPPGRPDVDMALDMVCPGCGAIGAFVDYTKPVTV